MINQPFTWHTVREEDGTPRTMTTTVPIDGLEPAYAMLRLVAEHLVDTEAAEYFTVTATPAYLYIDLRPHAIDPLPDSYETIANNITALLAPTESSDTAV